MALTDKHQLKFNIHKDAKSLIEAIENMFGGNKETKKVQKTLLKQQHENFSGSSSESLDQIHDRLQKLISQLEILADLEDHSLDDLFNNLKIYEAEVKSSSSTSHNTRNISFVSSNNTDNTNESVSAVPSVSAASTQVSLSTLPNVDNLSDAVANPLYTLRDKDLLKSKDPQVVSEPADLEDQILDDLFNNLKIYEAEVKSSSSTSHNTQHIAFVSSNNTNSTNESVSVVLCVSAASTKTPVSTLLNVDSLSDAVIYSFFTNGHAYYESQEVSSKDWKESRSPRDNRNKDTQRRTIPVETSTSNALVSQCDEVGGYDWSFQTDEEPTNYALMAFTSSSSLSSLGSDNEVASCSKACSKAYANLQSHYDRSTVYFKKSQFDVLSYKSGLESVEARLVVYQQNKNVFEEDIKLLKLDVMLRDNALVSSSKSNDSVPTSHVNDRYKSGEWYHVIPPPYTRTFMPSKLDLVFHDAPPASETVPNVVNVEPSTTKPTKDMSQSNRPSAPIIKDWVSDSKDEYEGMLFQQQLTRSRLVPLNAAKPVNTIVPHPTMKSPKTVNHVATKAHSPIRRPINHRPAPKNSNFHQKFTTVKAKRTNDVVKLQALIDRKKVVITEDTIRQDLRLDEADGVECLPSEEIFAELVRMGYEKAPPKLTFYKAFFSAQWKFLIHTIIQCMSAKRTAWNKCSSSIASAIIRLATGVETSLFDTMLVQHQADVEDDDDDEVSNAPTPPSPPPAPPSSPVQEQPTQPTNTSESSMTLHNTLMETCATLTQKVAHLEQNKVAQALEITKLKKRVKRLERNGRSKHFGLKRLTKVDAYEDVTFIDVDTAVEMDADIQGRMEEDVTAVKEINAAESEPTVFDDEEMQEKHLDNIRKYHNLKRKPISVAQARKNMIVYLKNMARYKIAHFKGVTYDQVRSIFEREYNKVQTFLKPNKDEEPIKKRGVEETLLQERFKMLRAEVEASGYHTTQDTPTDDPKEMSEEDVKNTLQIVLVA
uniref:Uncharacterized protein n=1 Tax=Tanacetum cinerariifolium TaxID=118510 RepID=A0A699HXE8_TANCI|nr:hypothetical protein [Tanacetum cinerariifolium]